MTAHLKKSVEGVILDVVHGRRDLAGCEGLINSNLDVLMVLDEYLAADWPIEKLERCESLLKAVLYANLKGGVSGEVARQVALFQKSVGFLFKYKSYSIKCASPLGYSVFLQNPGEGFSFQQHISHKTEVFHIIKVHPGGYVFICSFDDWRRCYDKNSFARWLGGSPDERYDRFKFEARPGDVFTVDRLNVVHSVVGCVLEEFATISTDMVDRLHDQNAGKQIPPHFNRRFAREKLQSFCTPPSSRHVGMLTPERRIREIEPVEIKGGQEIPISSGTINTSRYVMRPSEMGEVKRDDGHAASLHITEGVGRVVIGDHYEVRQTTPPSIPVGACDLLFIPPGISYAFVNEGASPMKLSEHKIPLDVAFN
jgi:mannose-6-phosphate isomerase-like protein (cupin superfamily)